MSNPIPPYPPRRRSNRTVMNPSPNTAGFGRNRVEIERDFHGCSTMGGVTDYCILRTNPALPVFIAIAFGWSSDSDKVAVLTSHNESLQYRLVNPERVYWLSHGMANSSERGVTNMMSKTDARALWGFLRDSSWLVWDTDTLPQKVGGAILWRVLSEKISESNTSLILNS